MKTDICHPNKETSCPTLYQIARYRQFDPKKKKKRQQNFSWSQPVGLSPDSVWFRARLRITCFLQSNPDITILVIFCLVIVDTTEFVLLRSRGVGEGTG